MIRSPAGTLAALVFALSTVTGGAAWAFDLQGHRGARGLAPENTLFGFATALGIGVGTLELDTGVTRDGVVVVSHNSRLSADLSRAPDGRWLDAPGPAINALTFAELEKYDVGRLRPGSRYARRFPNQTPHDGARIPALAAVLALAARAGNETVRFNVETKIDPRAPALSPPPDAFADALIAVLRGAHLERRATVQSFDWRTLRRVQAVAPEFPTVCLSAERSWLDNIQRGRPGPSIWTAGLDIDAYEGSLPRLVADAGCRAWSPYYGDLNGDAIDEAHALGLTVIPWTVDARADMARLIALGADGIITDYPDRLRAVMAEQGLPLPAATPISP